MALQRKISGPGGLSSDQGYTRATGIQIDFTRQLILIPVVDYASAADRQSKPEDVVNPRAYGIYKDAQKARQSPEQKPDGTVVVHDLDAVPSFAEVMDGDLTAVLAKIGPSPTLRKVLGEMIYAHLRSRKENAGATDV